MKGHVELISAQNQLQDPTRFGEISEVLEIEIDNERRQVTVYWKNVDSVWTLYTSVLDDGTILDSSRSLQQPLFSDQELERFEVSKSKELQDAP